MRVRIRISTHVVYITSQNLQITQPVKITWSDMTFVNKYCRAGSNVWDFCFPQLTISWRSVCVLSQECWDMCPDISLCTLPTMYGVCLTHRHFPSTILSDILFWLGLNLGDGSKGQTMPSQTESIFVIMVFSIVK